MEIDRKTLKALSTDSRMDILKSLGERRKFSSELSKELGLAPSTIVEHLKVLEDTSLIQRKDTGHKWIYYELTEKGRNLVKPTITTHIVLVLSLGFGFLITGGLRLFEVFMTPSFQAAKSMAEDAMVSGAAAERLMPQLTIDWVSIIVLVMGLILLLIGFLGFIRKR